ncbi:DinB family protein [Phytomonospora sp. NPDC050363]|uniref:DinB family protein n=1 Tax=Phytomonospora sp. NPDC050363 TaxID=3155642 RepID=UPI0033C6C84C
MTRTDVPTSWDEKTTLTTFLDYARSTVLHKCAGLSDEDARSAPLPGSPLTNIASLVNHLRWVEYWWFQVMFLGEEEDAPWTEEDPDGEMTVALTLPLADILADYEATCAKYRELVAGLDLDALSERKNRAGQRFTLRWVITHMVEETSRHNGHIDLLREMADGVTGS